MCIRDSIDTVLKGGEQAMRDLRDASVARWFTAGFAEREPAQVERIVAMLAATSPQGYAANCAAVRDADFREQLGLVQAPTLIVAGSHDAVTTPDNARFMQARIALSLIHICLISPAAIASNCIFAARSSSTAITQASSMLAPVASRP